MIGSSTFQLPEKRFMSIRKSFSSASNRLSVTLKSLQLFFRSSAIFFVILDFTTSPYSIRAVRMIKSVPKRSYAPTSNFPNSVFALGQYASRIDIVISDFLSARPPLLNRTNISSASSWLMSLISVNRISFSTNTL